MAESKILVNARVDQHFAQVHLKANNRESHDLNRKTPILKDIPTTFGPYPYA
jgi:hypothetical protein